MHNLIDCKGEGCQKVKKICNTPGGGAVQMFFFCMLVKTFEDDIMKWVWVSGVLTGLLSLALIAMQSDGEHEYSTTTVGMIASGFVFIVGVIGWWICSEKKEDYHQQQTQDEIRGLTTRMKKAQGELESSLKAMLVAGTDMDKVKDESKKQLRDLEKTQVEIESKFKELATVDNMQRFFEQLLKAVDEGDAMSAGALTEEEKKNLINKLQNMSCQKFLHKSDFEHGRLKPVEYMDHLQCGVQVLNDTEMDRLEAFFREVFPPLPKDSAGAVSETDTLNPSATNANNDYVRFMNWKANGANDVFECHELPPVFMELLHKLKNTELVDDKGRSMFDDLFLFLLEGRVEWMPQEFYKKEIQALKESPAFKEPGGDDGEAEAKAGDDEGV